MNLFHCCNSDNLTAHAYFMQFPIYLSSIFIGVKWWLRACCVDRRELCPLAPLGDILINCWCRKSQANSTVESIWRKRTLKYLGRVIYRVICCRILHTTHFILTSLSHSAAFSALLNTSVDMWWKLWGNSKQISRVSRSCLKKVGIFLLLYLHPLLLLNNTPSTDS